MKPALPFPTAVPTHRGSTHRPLALALSLALGACGGGSGGQGGTGPEPGLNEGSYSVDDFDYVDEHPAGFHPLGNDGFQVFARDELFGVFPTADGVGRTFAMQDDPDTGYAPLHGIDGLFTDTGPLVAACSGQVDEDAASELMVVARSTDGAALLVYQVDRIAGDTYERTALHALRPSWAPIDARIELGDVDGDFRDELVVVARSGQWGDSASAGHVWVLDDPLDGGALLLSYERSGGHIGLWGLPVDVDGDGAKEVAIGLSGDTTDSGRYAIRLYDLAQGAASMTQVHGWQYLYHANDQHSSRAVAGDFDNDGREELCWVGYSVTSSGTKMLYRYFDFASGSWRQFRESSQFDFSPPPAFGLNQWSLTTVQRSPGQDDVAFAYPISNTEYLVYSAHYDPGPGQTLSLRTATLDRRLPGQGITIAGSDVDGDGAEEIQVALLQHAGSQRTLDLGHVLRNGSGFLEVTWQDRQTTASGPVTTGRVPVPVIACGDYDADGLALQHTGRRSPKVGNPIPIAVLSAPPTVAGISQNYDDTESAYSTGTSMSTSIGITTQSAVTYGVGAGFDLFGMLSVGGRVALQKATQRTVTETSQTSVVTGYRGAYDADVIVFQGTLYETYEYRIVGAPDPDAIGQRITLDIPVDANTYKWTVDYYNSSVDPEDRIESDVLTHTPGEITSYPDRLELAALMAGEMHWDLQGSRPVGQGNASDFQSVSFAHESATEVQRTVTRSYGGGATFGIGVDVEGEDTRGTTHSVSFASETTFEASVGDISDPVDYGNWRYNWGFSIHTVGRTVDGANQPTGYTGRRHTFEYLRYWVEPTGSAY